MSRYSIAVTAALLAAAVFVGSALHANAESLRIAMVVWRGETAAEKGFRDGLRKIGYTAEFTVINAEQDRTTLRSKLEKTILPHLEKYDYVYTFGTTASKMTKDLVRGRIPQLFNIVNEPAKAGIVSSMDEPGDNISGASNAVPLAAQIEAGMKLFAIKKLGLLFNPREKNAMIQRDEINAMAAARGFTIVDLRSPPARDMLEQNLQKLADKSVAVDAVYLPADSFLISEAKLIGAKLRTAKIKSIGAVRTYVASGALMGVVPDYHQLGTVVAEILDQNRKGKRLGRIPVHVTKTPKLVVNEQTRAAFGLSFPEAVLGHAELLN